MDDYLLLRREKISWISDMEKEDISCRSTYVRGGPLAVWGEGGHSRPTTIAHAAQAPSLSFRSLLTLAWLRLSNQILLLTRIFSHLPSHLSNKLHFFAWLFACWETAAFFSQNLNFAKWTYSWFKIFDIFYFVKLYFFISKFFTSHHHHHPYHLRDTLFYRIDDKFFWLTFAFHARPL